MRKALTYPPTKVNVRAYRPQWERVNIIIADLLPNVKRERKCCLMNAFRCDFCGELFAYRGEIRINSLLGIYYTLLKNNDDTVIDICDTCRCRIQDLLDDIRDDRIKKEKEEEREADELLSQILM